MLQIDYGRDSAKMAQRGVKYQGHVVKNWLGEKRVDMSELLCSSDPMSTFDPEIQQNQILASKPLKRGVFEQYFSEFAFSVIGEVNLDLRS